MTETVQSGASPLSIFATEQRPPGKGESGDSFALCLQNSINRVNQTDETPKPRITACETTTEDKQNPNTMKVQDNCAGKTETDRVEAKEPIKLEQEHEKTTDEKGLTSFEAEIALPISLDIRLAHPPDSTTPQRISAKGTEKETATPIAGITDMLLHPSSTIQQKEDVNWVGVEGEIEEGMSEPKTNNSKIDPQTATPIFTPLTQAEPTNSVRQTSDDSQKRTQSGVRGVAQKNTVYADQAANDVSPPQNQTQTSGKRASETEREAAFPDTFDATVGKTEKIRSDKVPNETKQGFTSAKYEPVASKPSDYRSIQQQEIVEGIKTDLATAVQMQSAEVKATNAEQANATLQEIGTMAITEEAQGKPMRKGDANSISTAAKSAVKTDQTTAIPVGSTQTVRTKAESQVSDAKGNSFAAETKQVGEKPVQKERLQTPVAVEQIGAITENYTVRSTETVESQVTDTTAYEPFTEQITFRVSAALKTGEQSFTMKLNPEGLGELTVSMKLSDGALSLEMGANLDSTKHMLSDKIGELKLVLQQSDIRVTNVSVKGENATSSSAAPFFSFRQNSGNGGRFVPQFEMKQTPREIPFSYQNATAKRANTFTSGLLNYRI